MGAGRMPIQVKKSKSPTQMPDAVSDYRLIKSPGFLLFLAGFLLS